MNSTDKAAQAKASFDDAVRRSSQTPEFAAVAIGHLVLHLLENGEQVDADAIVSALRAIETGDLSGVMLPEQAEGALTVIRQLRPELVSW